MSDDNSIPKIKTSVFSRSLTLAKVTLESGGKLLAQKISSRIQNKDESNKKLDWEKFLIERAADFADEFGKLKGSIMKAGQLLSMYGGYFLPKEANDFLKSLQSSSPPLKFEQIYKLLQKELGVDKLDRLVIDPKPAGCASLGQVHRAQEKKTGRYIALKVQYPGVENAIDSDLTALRALLQMIQIIPKSVGMDQIFNEIREMLLQEIDYEYEAQETEKYQKRLASDPRYVVPSIIPEFCSKKVIATEFISGYRADSHWVANLAESRKETLGLNFLELYFKELFHWGVVQTDPHLGNYAIIPGSQNSDYTGERIVLFDFGAIRYYPEKFLKPYYKMIFASLKGDRVELRKAAFDLNFLQPNDPPKLIELFEQFCLGTVEPFLEPSDPRVQNDPAMKPDGRYDWSNSPLPQRLSHVAWQMIKSFELRAPPREILFLDRKTGGVFVFLATLKTPLKARPLLLEALKQFT